MRDDGGVVVGKETLDEGSEDSLGSSEDHFLVDDDLEKKKDDKEREKREQGEQGGKNER